MAAEVEVSMAVAVEVSVAVEVPIVAVENLVEATPMACGLMAEGVTAEAVDLKLAATQAHPLCGRPLVIRRIFVLRSTMVGGIRSATPAVPRMQVKDAIPQAPRTPTSRLIAPEFPMPGGTLLARQQVLSAEAPERFRGSVSVAMAGEAVGLASAGIGA